MIEGNATKTNRVEGKEVPRSAHLKRRVRREVEDVDTHSPTPVDNARLPTPETSTSMSNPMAHNLMHELGGSGTQASSSHEADYDNDTVDEANDGGPEIEDRIPSYKEHVAYAIWNGLARGILTGHHRNTSLRSWSVVMQEAAGFIQSSGLGGLLESMYDALDMPLICAFIERWYPETNTFHMPFGEMTITLHDTEFLLGIPASGLPIAPLCDGIPTQTLTMLGAAIGITDMAELKERIGWQGSYAKQALIRKVAEQPRTPPSRLAMIYLWWLVTSMLFVDKRKTHCHASFIELLKNSGEAKKYAWGAGTLANLYRELGMASRRDCKQVAGCLILLQSWIYAYFPSLRPQARRSWTPEQSYSRMWIPTAVKSDGGEAALLEHRRHLDILTAASVEWLPFGPCPGDRVPISTFTGIIHCRSINEPYMPDRVSRQFGYVQSVPADPIISRDCKRSANPREYKVKHDPAYWVFNVRRIVSTFQGFKEVTVGSDFDTNYTEWYIPMAHPKVRRVTNEDEDIDDTTRISNPFQLLQQVAGIVAPYHMTIYDGMDVPESETLKIIADLCQHMMPSMTIGRGSRVGGRGNRVRGSGSGL